MVLWVRKFHQNTDKLNKFNFTWGRTILWTRQAELASVDICVPTERFRDEGQSGLGAVPVGWTCVLTIRVVVRPQLLSADFSGLSVRVLADLSAQVQVAAFRLTPLISKKLLSAASGGTQLIYFPSPTSIYPAGLWFCS